LRRLLGVANRIESATRIKLQYSVFGRHHDNVAPCAERTRSKYALWIWVTVGTNDDEHVKSS